MCIRDRLFRLNTVPATKRSGASRSGAGWRRGETRGGRAASHPAIADTKMGTLDRQGAHPGLPGGVPGSVGELLVHPGQDFLRLLHGALDDLGHGGDVLDAAGGLAHHQDAPLRVL